MRASVPGAVSRTVSVDGIGTHYLEAGEGTTVVLLHSAEFGGCAELSWERVIAPLAESYRVIAPDWLGFGLTDKLYDFGGGRARMIAHMRRFLEVLCIDRADFVGSSMAGSMLMALAATRPTPFPIRSLIAASGGGFVPNNEARQVVQAYDGTPEAMRRVLHVLFHDKAWALDDAYVERRVRWSLVPGAWECAAAARFHSPVTPARPQFGRPDKTEYEQIEIPTLIVAGADDQLREQGYAEEVAARIPQGDAVVLERCGHLPNVERAQEFTAATLGVLARVHGGVSATEAA